MIITIAGRDQFQTVREFYHSLIDAMADSPYYIGWEKDVYPAPDYLADAIRKGELYLLTENGRIAAAMILNHENNEGYNAFQWQTEADSSEVMVIHALGVHPDFAHSGYAKALVRKAIELAGESGMRAIRLDVLEGNTPAEKLYEGLGFQYMATLQMFYEDTGWTNFRLYEYVV